MRYPCIVLKQVMDALCALGIVEQKIGSSKNSNCRFGLNN